MNKRSYSPITQESSSNKQDFNVENLPVGMKSNLESQINIDLKSASMPGSNHQIPYHHYIQSVPPYSYPHQSQMYLSQQMVSPTSYNAFQYFQQQPGYENSKEGNPTSPVSVTDSSPKTTLNNLNNFIPAIQMPMTMPMPVPMPIPMQMQMHIPMQVPVQMSRSGQTSEMPIQMQMPIPMQMQMQSQMPVQLPAQVQIPVSVSKMMQYPNQQYTPVTFGAKTADQVFYRPPFLEPEQLSKQKNFNYGNMRVTSPSNILRSERDNEKSKMLIQQQQQQPQMSLSYNKNDCRSKVFDNDSNDIPRTNDIAALTPIPGCMAYHHPLFSIVPSASGNTRKHVRENSSEKNKNGELVGNVRNDHILPYSNSVLTSDLNSDSNSDSNPDLNSNLNFKSEIRRMAFGSPTWTRKDDELLRYLKEHDKIGWRDISMYFPTRTINACQFRWRRLIMREENKKKKDLHKMSIKEKLGNNNITLKDEDKNCMLLKDRTDNGNTHEIIDDDNNIGINDSNYDNKKRIKDACRVEQMVWKDDEGDNTNN